MLMMQSLAQEYAHEKIRVNGIAPGAVKTQINTESWDDPAAEKDLLRLVPYGRIGEPDDIAQAALWLASDASDYVTGETIVRRRRHGAVSGLPRRRMRARVTRAAPPRGAASRSASPAPSRRYRRGSPATGR